MPVYKQPNSRNWLIEFKVDGRRYRRSSGTTVKRKAIRLEEKWRQEIHDGKHHIGKAQSLTIEEAADRYYLTVIRPNNSREKSKYAEKCCLNVIVRYFSPKTGLNAIQSGDIARWRDTMLSNGARLSEALDLRWDNVDLDGANKASITLMRTKNGVPRRIPLTSRAKNLLLQLRACRIDLDKPVFLYQAPGTSEPVPFRNPFGSWKTALRDAGMDNSLRIHDLRHTFASRLVSNGVPIFDVSKLLGHKSIAMTMRYAHLAPVAFENAIEKLENRNLSEGTDGSGNVVDLVSENVTHIIQ